MRSPEKIPPSQIGEQYGLNLHSIYRHSKHLGRSIIVEGGQPLVTRIETLMARLERIASKAETAKDWRCAVLAIREVRDSLELVARLTGQMPSVSQGTAVAVAVNVTTNRSTHELSNYDLELQLAADVAAATDDFNSTTIARLQRLVEKNRTPHHEGGALEITPYDAST